MVRCPIERPWHLSFPGVTWDAAWSSGNLHGSGMSKGTTSSRASATTTNSKFMKALQAIRNMGNRPRFPVMWKALKICQGVDIEPSVVSG